LLGRHIVELKTMERVDVEPDAGGAAAHGDAVKPLGDSLSDHVRQMAVSLMALHVRSPARFSFCNALNYFNLSHWHYFVFHLRAYDDAFFKGHSSAGSAGYGWSRPQSFGFGSCGTTAAGMSAAAAAEEQAALSM
jgi:hypothetical protein